MLKNGGGWWFGETEVKGAWLYLCPPPQTTVSELQDTNTRG